MSEFIPTRQHDKDIIGTSTFDDFVKDLKYLQIQFPVGVITDVIQDVETKIYKELDLLKTSPDTKER